MNKIATPLLEAFQGKIINIHPSSFTEAWGKGMYGMHVHEAVVAAGGEGIRYPPYIILMSIMMKELSSFRYPVRFFRRYSGRGSPSGCML